MKRPSKSILDDRSTLVEDLEQGAPASRVWLYLVALFVTLATLAAYQPTLFNFFNADDFVLLNWLKAASKDHSLVWQEFGRPWLGLMSNYYRPLVNMVLAAEYSIWGTNGLYFRLANILCELFTSLVIGLIVYELSGSNRQANSERLRLTWSIAAAALFALYPLHCEPINWVVSQLEVMVTLFGLFSLWCYMRWRRSNQKRFLISGLSSLIFAFLSKEMAVVLPLIMFIYEFLLVDRNGTEEGTRGVRSVASQAGKALIQTLPFWLILAAYLALRKVVLGQIFGSVGATALFGPAQVFHASLHSLWKTFVPINQSALSLLSPAAILWQVFIAAFFGMSVYKFRASADKSLAMFLLAWMICAIAPIYSVFLIDSNLQRARLAYMATVPICIMLTYGISAFCSNPKACPLRQKHFPRTCTGRF